MREHQEERGLSAHHLILLFLAGVAVCGVFFSLGFLVGFNERFSRPAPPTERVTAPAAIPPTVNPPVESVKSTPQEAVGEHTPGNPAPDVGAAQTAGPSRNPVPSQAKAAAATPTAPQHAAAAPATSQQPAAAPAPGEVGEGITLQVAALRSKQDAEALVNILKGRGYPVFLVTPEYAHANDNLFRVQVGPFKTRDDAEKVRAKLSREGFKPFIRH
jgi:cell division septation protein DedD